ncbi:MAG: ribulose-phosphate 3-epimerase [Planctomycetota bacterium]
MPAIDVLPSLLSADFGRLAEDIAACEAAGARILHCDIMDGHFVPNISFGPGIVETIRRHASGRLDVHLMLSDPMRYAEAFRDAGADALTIHVEAVGQRGVDAAIERIHELGMRAGLVFNPDTDPQLWMDRFAAVDQVMFMTVYPGFGGQSFIPEVRPFIRKARTAHPGLDILVDGGIDRRTIPLVCADGANLLVCGSAFFKDADRADFMAQARQCTLGDGT